MRVPELGVEAVRQIVDLEVVGFDLTVDAAYFTGGIGDFLRLAMNLALSRVALFVLSATW